MTCTNCSAAVERVLHGLRGVRRANVALTLGEARVAYDSAFTDEVSLTLSIHTCHPSLLAPAQISRRCLWHTLASQKKPSAASTPDLMLVVYCSGLLCWSAGGYP